MKLASAAEDQGQERPKRLGLTRAPQWLALFSVLTVLVGLALLFAPLSGRSVAVTEGLTLHWLALTVGTNSFQEGNPLEKLLGDRIPAKGFGLGALKLHRPLSHRPPETTAPLTAWIRATGPGLQEMQYQLYRGFKVMTANSSGRELEHPPAMACQVASNEVLLAISLYAFPRDEGTVRLRIAPPLDNKQERRWAEFEFENPLGATNHHWRLERLPITNEVGSDRFVLFNVLTNPTRLIFHAPSKGWFLSQCTIWDDEGNRSAMSSGGYGEREIAVTFAYPLEANRPWKVSAGFTRAPPHHRLLELGQFTPEDWLRVQVDTSATYVSVTNTAGTVYRWRFDGQQLSAWNATDPAKKPEFVMMSATNELGREVKFLDTAWMSRGTNVTQVWSTREQAASLVVELGVPKAASLDFYVRPR